MDEVNNVLLLMQLDFQSFLFFSLLMKLLPVSSIMPFVSFFQTIECAEVSTFILHLMQVLLLLKVLLRFMVVAFD
jgi:hypothetical protein